PTLHRMIRLFLLLYFYGHGDPRHLHSFPTRRSSDLHPYKKAQRAIMQLYREQHLQEISKKFQIYGQILHAEACKIGISSRFPEGDRKSTRLNSSHVAIPYAVFCLKKKDYA